MNESIPDQPTPATETPAPSNANPAPGAPETTASTVADAGRDRKAAAKGSGRGPRHHPLLDTLAGLYPALFGENPRPLKRGIFHDLRAAHPDTLDADGLKAALALHTRSTRYLNAVAAGQRRHDLAGEPVEDMAPEHIHQALLEVFRRRQGRRGEDLRPQLVRRIARTIEASGLSREAYAARVRGRDEAANALLDEALAEVAPRLARDEALLRAFEASGQTEEAFAGMYGLPPREAGLTLARARQRRAAA